MPERWECGELQPTAGNGRTLYFYDGAGRRVLTQAADGTSTVFVYDAQGNLAAEYDAVAPAPICNTCYVTQDHLGSTRMITDAGGCAVYRQDYLPFGETIMVSPGQPRYGATGGSLCPTNGYLAGTAPTKAQFTGKERDTESGMDYFGARYFAGAQGRFTSPDEPFADQNAADPQSWNLYSYVRNNPLTNTDGDGRAVNVCIYSENGGQSCVQMENDQYAQASQGNAGLNVPTLNQVGMNSDGNGNFNSTNVTDTSGRVVATATYVSEGATDYYANRNGIDMLATTTAIVGSPKGIAAFYGASIAGGAALYGLVGCPGYSITGCGG